MTLALLNSFNVILIINNDCYAINTENTDGSKRKKHPHWVAFGKYANTQKSFVNLQNFADIDIVFILQVISSLLCSSTKYLLPHCKYLQPDLEIFNCSDYNLEITMGGLGVFWSGNCMDVKTSKMGRFTFQIFISKCQ